MAEQGDANPLPVEPVYMVAGTDTDGDCHAIFTDSAVRAIGHFRRMSAIFDDVRGNENFELLRPVIADFDADRDMFDRL